MIDVNWDLAPEGAKEIKLTNRGKMYFSNDEGFYYHGTWKPLPCSNWKTIATRPAQTKTVADAVEQEGEKWTHCYCGEKCKIIGEPDSFGRVVILTESDAYFLDKPETLKPIKPTLTKAQAWDRLNSGEFYNAQYGIDTLKHDYDII